MHIDGAGKPNPYSPADCALISEARRQRKPSVRVSDVALPSGKILQFEVRIGSNAVSRKFPKPPRSMLIQVNLATEDTRVVEVGEQDTTFAPPAAPSPAPAPAPAPAAAGGGGGGGGWDILGADGQWRPLPMSVCAAVGSAMDQGEFIIPLSDGQEMIDLSREPPLHYAFRTVYKHKEGPGKPLEDFSPEANEL